jgi:hypothetical protein
MADRVECYAGASQAETPRRVVWQGQTYPVTEVLSRQRQPDALTFQVRCEPDETLFELSYIITTGTWQIHFKGNLPLSN